MKTEDFDFKLPQALIAQYPCEPRDKARMMIVNRKQRSIKCGYFRDISGYLNKDDTLIINDSKVIPARLFGKKPTGGMIEILLLSRKDEGSPHFQIWEALLRPAKRVKIGTEIVFGEESSAKITKRISDKKWLLNFQTEISFEHFLEKYGRAPLPPYIKRDKTHGTNFHDLTRYQTVYARMPGSVAAPTAGLHFSKEILKKMRDHGVQIAPVTLHVGYGTFLPIETLHVEDHLMESEYFELSKETADIVNEAKRLTAVGTTSTRVLESLTDRQGKVKSSSGYTNLFIHPGYQFKKVDRLITNFHLPKSSLFLLVCAFAGTELMKKAYKKAIEEKFRFYSYGDCMLII
ncbi:MAG: tRNA preQ1(34) S-adenosylmethionine ribosyltransferase-isomerase QueA [Syntrophobacterales bacterium]|nr:tRNA preQ1(34) S-adenosylmethionine ribosyltransferase-isomerase QueA [Syntrophobacterales bacterium]